jgi:hypothetical protein
MLRIIVRTDDAGMAANVGGAVLSNFATFDVDLPEVEKCVRDGDGKYCHSQVVGVELLPEAQATAETGGEGE